MRLCDDEFWKPVVTTRMVIDGGDVITGITLDEEGDWEVLGDSDFTDEDLDVLSVEEILSLDPSLALLPDLLPGQSAVREARDASWRIVE